MDHKEWIFLGYYGMIVRGATPKITADALHAHLIAYFPSVCTKMLVIPSGICLLFVLSDEKSEGVSGRSELFALP